MTKENQFLVSVADVKFINPLTGDLILNAKTELDSTMTQSVQSQLINAGKGAKTIYEYNFTKELLFTVTDAVFDFKYLAMQNGTGITRELSDYYADEKVMLDSTGKGTLKHTPVGNVHVESETGEYVQVIPTGDEFVYANLKDKEVKVSYVYKETMDKILITGDAFPKAVTMVMNADINTNAGKVSELQITVPRFKPDGALELSLTTDGVSSMPMSGRALDHDGVYAELNIKMMEGQAVTVNKIFVDAPEIDMLAGQTPADTETIKVFGVRGGLYGIVPMDNADLTFTSDDPTIVSVDGDGVITVEATANAGDVTLIRVVDSNNANNKDTVEVTIV